MHTSRGLLFLTSLLLKSFTVCLGLRSCEFNSTTILGAGASYPALYYQDIGTLFANNRSQFLQYPVAFQYERVNSGYGLQRVMGEIEKMPPVNFGAGQTPMNDSETHLHTNLITFPTLAGAIVILFNLPESDRIKMSMTVIADIYLGKITYWDDPRIQDSNMGLSLPHKKIFPIARSDDSGDTEAFTQALTTCNPEWSEKFGMFGSSGFIDGHCCNSTNWPNSIAFFAQRVSGLIGLVSSIPYTMGYAAKANAEGMGVNYVTLINQQNFPVEPTDNAVIAAIAYWDSVVNNSQLVADLSNANSSDAYPIVTYTYITLDLKSVGLSCCSVRETVGWITAMLTNPQYIAKTKQYYLVPIKPAQVSRIIRQILMNITCNEENMYNSFMESLIVDNSDLSLRTGSIVGVCTILVLATLAWILEHKRRQIVAERTWFLSFTNLRFCIKVDNLEILSFPLEKVSYEDEKLLIGELKTTSVKSWNQSAKTQVSRIMKMTHPNLISFRGVVWNDKTMCSLHGIFPYFNYPKGSLHHILCHIQFELSQTVRKNLVSDVAEGLEYLHSKDIFHGSLNSLCCYVEQSWTVRIADWFNSSIYLAVDKRYQFELPKISNELTKSKLIELLYVDPELKKKSELNSSMDAYSFAMLVAEVFTGKIPYHNEVDLGYISYTSILNAKFHELHTRLPKMPRDTSTSLSQLITACLRPLASDRPPMREISNLIWGSGEVRTGIVDSMMTNMELCMTQLQAVTARMQDLLHQMLPAKIADKLFQGQSVEPELFECVSIYFSDICGFTDISAQSTPAQVMEFLNDLWTLFDSVLEKFDTYKVDTIGDAYMVASGLPERNGVAHVVQIATLAITLLQETTKFFIPHMPNERLKIRIGLNSGPVIAGVVGKKMPQYCIFGDAVNTARMESTSLPLQIQASESFANLLDEVDTDKVFKTELRGTIQVKVIILKLVVYQYRIKKSFDHQNRHN